MSKWDELSMAERAAMMKVAVRNGITNLSDIREKYNEFAQGGELTDKEYYTTMEKVADENYNKWGLSNSDEALVQALNDNTYNYRGYYSKYPESAANADTHWSDEFKTVYHPTFSTQSIYSGQKSQYNPEGLFGGHWVGKNEDVFIPAPWQRKTSVYAQGGNTKSDDDLIDRIIQEEGFSKKPEDIGDGKRTLGSGLTAKKWHDLYEKRGNKWSAADNRRAVAEEVANRRRWAERNIPNWEKLPDSSQKALLSYKYNYDFTRSNSPKLFKALEAGNLQEAARQMDATSKDPKFKKGLQARRQREQNWFLSDLNLNQRPTTAMPVETPVSTAVYNPFAIQQQTTQAYPIMVPDEDSYVTAHPLTTGELKAQEMKERFDAVNRFNALMNMIGFENNPLPSFTSTSNVFLDSLSPLINSNANGGKIYIKPSHRGRLTELKARTGKTEAELYNDGNPAHKKMVVFARNARRWKHGLGGNLFDGTTEDSQKMQVGLRVTNDWKPFTLDDVLANAARIEQQKQAMEDRLNNVFTLSNDATSVANGRPQNRHLERRAVEGAKAHRAWEEEHPAATQWGNVLGAVPFAVASVPLGAGIVAGGDALAATTTGQAVTAGLTPLYQAATSATIAGAPALAWANTGLQSLMASHGLSEVANGTFTPTTALELTPLAPGIVRTPGIINNLRPQNIRNHLYVAKPPIEYDGIGNAAERWIRGIASGKPANIDNPWWFNSNNARRLQDYAYVPETVQGIEREQYLQQFGEHALEARADAWRMHNLIPQKYNTFTPNPRHPGSFTDIEGIRRLKYIPPQTEGTPQVDFVNSVGGNVGVPEITNLGNGIPDTGTQIKRFGVTTTSDWFDLHPFSREEDRLIPRFVKPLWNKHIADPILYDAKWMKKVTDRFKYNDAEIRSYLAQNKNDEYAMEMFDPDMFPATGWRRKVGDTFESLSNGFERAARTPEFRFLKPLEDKMIKLEAGDITGGRPFLVQYDIPFTTNIRFTSEAPGVVTEQVPGFVSENLLPQSVFNWKHGVYTEPANINLENNFDFLNTTLTRKSKR